MSNNLFTQSVFPMWGAPMAAGGIASNYLANKDIGGSGNFFGNKDRVFGAVLTGGLSEVGRKLFGGRGIKYTPPMYREGATYGRPQTRLAMNEAQNPYNNDAPTIGDYRTDMNIAPTVNFHSRFLGGNSTSFLKKRTFPITNPDINSTITTPFGGGYSRHAGQNIAALNNFNKDTSRRWEDTNGSQLGGKQAYRYAWEQPGFQNQNTNQTIPTPEQQWSLQQTPEAPKMSSPASSQPISNDTSTKGWGFSGNNKPATFGNQDVNFQTNPQAYQGGYTGGYNPTLWSGNYGTRTNFPTTSTQPNNTGGLFASRGNYYNPSFGRY